jgi:transketolase N-terminal domain/subunit
MRSECERSVRVPLYVYARVLEARDQCILHSGHHAFARYRTIVAFGLMRIEEKA